MTKPKAKPSLTKITTVVTSSTKPTTKPAAKKPTVVSTPAKKAVPAKKTTPAKKTLPVKKASAIVQKQKPVVPPQVKSNVEIKPIVKPTKPSVLSVKDIFQKAVVSNPLQTIVQQPSKVVQSQQNTPVTHTKLKMSEVTGYLKQRSII